MLQRPVESRQYTSIAYTERLCEIGLAPLVGSVGDPYDNAVVESTIGLYKTEAIRPAGPFKTIDDVEYATFEWVDWYNNRRLHSASNNQPPAEFEEQYYQTTNPKSGLENQTI